MIRTQNNSSFSISHLLLPNNNTKATTPIHTQSVGKTDEKKIQILNEYYSDTHHGKSSVNYFFFGIHSATKKERNFCAKSQIPNN